MAGMKWGETLKHAVARQKDWGDIWNEKNMMYMTIQREEGFMRGSQNPISSSVFWIRTIDMGLQESAVVGHGYLSLAAQMQKSLSCERESRAPSPQIVL